MGYSELANPIFGGSSHEVHDQCDTNAGSNREVLDLMTDYPLFGLVTWDVRPVLDFKEGIDKIRAKLAEAQAAMAGG